MENVARERFMTRVRLDGGCWIWTGSRNAKGYGFYSLNGFYGRAHRAAWALFRGGIPEGMWVLHNCPGGDNPSCVNPDHLWLGTHQDNVADMIAKGRMPRGEHRAHAKLTGAAVRETLAALAAGETVASEATRLGVSQATLYRAVNGQTWAHVARGTR